MRNSLSGFLLLSFALLFGSACDSTSPATTSHLRITGRVYDGHLPTDPALRVRLRTWPAIDIAGVYEASPIPDSAGQFSADVGPLPAAGPDSVTVAIMQNDCAGSFQTTVTLRNPQIRRGSLTLPDLQVEPRLPPSDFGPHAEVCGVINVGTLWGEQLEVFFQIDSITFPPRPPGTIPDSVFGRWIVNHHVSLGSSYGYFAGERTALGFTAVLTTYTPGLCDDMILAVAIGGYNGVTMGPATLTGAEACNIPSGSLRLYRWSYGNYPLPPFGT